MKNFSSLVIFLIASMSLQTAAADECAVTIEAGDALSYSMSAIELPSSCATISVTFNHTGNLPAAAMGHNWVLAKTADLQAIQNDGNAAGAAGGYLKAGDARVIAATDIIGGGESTSVSFATAGLSAAEDYSFFCTVMSHSVVMKGVFTLNG